jgi:hypothetical protein
MPNSHVRAHEPNRATPRIGPIGIGVRLLVGALLIALALFWRDPSWRDAVLGLVLMPAIVLAALAVRARFAPAPLDATGPLGHLLNAAVFVPLFFIPATAGAAFLFYGASMLVAAARRSGGCEVTAISNLLLRRRDEVGCMLFAPVDIAESRSGHAPAAREARGP